MMVRKRINTCEKEQAMYRSQNYSDNNFDKKILVEDVISRWSSSLRCFGLRLSPEDTEAEELPLDH